jgi:hypothetical protein
LQNFRNGSAESGEQMLDNWPQVTALCGIATVVGAIFYHFYRRAFGEGRSAAINKNSNDLALTAMSKFEAMQRSLNDHMISDAANFAKLETMVGEQGRAQVAAENRIAAAMESFSKELGKMGERIDRVLEWRLAAPHA